MKIGDLARESGVSPRLLRYYEEQGLLESQRAPSGHRHYGADAPMMVGRIRRLLAAGLSTTVIREVLPCFSGAGPVLEACVADTLREQLDHLDGRISTLQDTRSALANLLSTAVPVP